MRRPVAVRVVGPMQWIVIPALITVAVTFLLATPVKLFGLSLPEPVIPMVLAFAWPLIRPSVVAPLALMGLCLFLDIFWAAQGAMGMWALALLAIYAVVLGSRAFLIGQETAVLFVWYAACCSLAFLLVYLIVSLKAGNAPSILALIGQVVPTLLLFPFADRMIERFEDGDVRFR
jgi:rod shape-determining protein MreD